MQTRTLFRWSATVLATTLVVMQLVPVSRTNPPVEVDIPTTAEVKEVLRRACYDCHSNETNWPWYGYVAPMSWLVARDVNKGRAELNFSLWNRLTTKDRVEIMHESWEHIQEGEMPPWFYLPLHRDAVLSERDRAILRNWGAERRSER